MCSSVFGVVTHQQDVGRLRKGPLCRDETDLRPPCWQKVHDENHMGMLGRSVVSVLVRFNKCKSGASTLGIHCNVDTHVHHTKGLFSPDVSHNSYACSHIVSDLITQEINLQVLCVSPVRLDLNVFQIQGLGRSMSRV